MTNDTSERAAVAAGIEDYYASDTEDNPLIDYLSRHFRPLDNFLDTLANPEEARGGLLGKWATMTDLAKSYGGNDVAAADLFSALLIGRLIADPNTHAEIFHERHETDDYYDVIRVVQQTSSGGATSLHPSRRGDIEIPDVTIPSPMLKPEVINGLTDSLPSLDVERLDHGRYFYTPTNGNLWRVTARAEYLKAARDLIRAGIDVAGVAQEVLVDSKGVDGLIAFLVHNDASTPLELAELWGGETYSKPSAPSAMSEALAAHDRITAA